MKVGRIWAIILRSLYATLARKLALESPRFSIVDGVLFHEDSGLAGCLQERSENNSSKRAMMEGSVDTSRRSVLGKLSGDGTGGQPCVVTSANAVMLVSTAQHGVVTATRREHQ